MGVLSRIFGINKLKTSLDLKKLKRIESLDTKISLLKYDIEHLNKATTLIGQYYQPFPFEIGETRQDEIHGFDTLKYDIIRLFDNEIKRLKKEKAKIAEGD